MVVYEPHRYSDHLGHTAYLNLYSHTYLDLPVWRVPSVAYLVKARSEESVGPLHEASFVIHSNVITIKAFILNALVLSGSL